MHTVSRTDEMIKCQLRRSAPGASRRNSAARALLTVLLATLWFAGASDTSAIAPSQPAQTAQSGAASSQKAVGWSASFDMPLPSGPISIRVLVQSPAETNTDLQIICLFRSGPSNKLSGSLTEINEKLKGLLDQIRQPNLFAGELGETLLIAPPSGSLGAKRLLLIGLGDSHTFTPQRMEFVGAAVYREAARLGVANPFFAPTILDGGVKNFSTGEVAAEFLTGFRRAARTDAILVNASATPRPVIESLTFLAGQAHALDTLAGLKSAVASKAP